MSTPAVGGGLMGVAGSSLESLLAQLHLSRYLFSSRLLKCLRLSHGFPNRSHPLRLTSTRNNFNISRCTQASHELTAEARNDDLDSICRLYLTGRGGDKIQNQQLQQICLLVECRTFSLFVGYYFARQKDAPSQEDD